MHLAWCDSDKNSVWRKKIAEAWGDGEVDKALLASVRN